MDIKKLFLLLALLVSHASFAGGGGGGFAGATEMTQIANNVELAMQSVQQEIHSVELIKNNYFQALQQMKAVGNGYSQPFQQTMAAYNTVMNTGRTLYSMQGNLSNLSGMLQQRRTEFGASNLSWGDWTARERRLIDSGDQNAQSKIEANRAVLENTQASLDAYQQAAQDMQATTGTHAATQQLGYQMSILGGDINKLLTITAQRNMTQGMAESDAKIQERRALDSKIKNDEIRQKNWSDTQRFIDMMKSGGR